MFSSGPSGMPNYFDSAMEDMNFSNTVEDSMASRPNGILGSLDQPQGIADHSNLFPSSAPIPSQVNGVSGSPDEPQVNTGHFNPYSSSGHMLTSVPSDMASYLNRTVGNMQATGDMYFSNAVQASMASQLPGVPGHESIPVWDGNRYDNSNVVQPGPPNLLGPIDASLSAAPAPTPAMSSVPAPAVDNNDEEGDIFEFINFDPEPEAEPEAESEPAREPKFSGSGIGHPRETGEDAAGAGNETSIRWGGFPLGPSTNCFMPVGRRVYTIWHRGKW